MADTLTTNYGWTKPEVGASTDTWGTKTNTNWDAVDSQVHLNQTNITAVQANIGVTVFSTTQSYVAGNAVNYQGLLYIANTAVAPGAFNPAQWNQVGAAVAVGATPPSPAQAGQLWWDNTGGQLYLFYTDANSSQWVMANTAPPLISIPANFQLVTPKITGVVDGSNAQPGQVGEYLTYTSPSSNVAWNTWISLASLSLSAGDWDVTGMARMNGGTGGTLMTSVSVGLGTTANGFDLGYVNAPAITGANAAQMVNAPRVRINNAASQIIYLSTYWAGGSGTTLPSTATISARRVR